MLPPFRCQSVPLSKQCQPNRATVGAYVHLAGRKHSSGGPEAATNRRFRCQSVPLSKQCQPISVRERSKLCQDQRERSAISGLVCAITIGWDAGEAWRLKSGEGRFGVNRCHYQNSASQTGRPLVPMCTSLAGSIPQEVPKRPRIGGFGVNRCHYQNSASQSVSGNDRNCAKISVSDQRSAGWFVPSRSVGTPARHGVNRDGSRAAVVVAADVAPLSSTNTNMRSRRSRGLAKPRC